MRCEICDAELKVEEIKIDPRYGTFDPCNVCLTAISEVFGEEGDQEETLLEEDDG